MELKQEGSRRSLDSNLYILYMYVYSRQTSMQIFIYQSIPPGGKKCGPRQSDFLIWDDVFRFQVHVHSLIWVEKEKYKANKGGGFICSIYMYCKIELHYLELPRKTKNTLVSC